MPINGIECLVSAWHALAHPLCDEWQCGEPSRPADGMKNMLLAASASMSVYVAAPIVTAAGFVDDSSKQSTNLGMDISFCFYLETAVNYIIFIFLYD